MVESVLLFVQANALAAYGAFVGTVALILNFLRYRHAVNDRKPSVRVEIIQKISEREFHERMKAIESQVQYSNDNYATTHEIKIRNIGNVSIHLQDAWLNTKDGNREQATMRYGRSGLYYEISALGNQEISPRASLTFSFVSNKKDGYLNPVRAYAIDGTGKEWRSKTFKNA